MNEVIFFAVGNTINRIGNPISHDIPHVLGNIENSLRLKPTVKQVLTNDIVKVIKMDITSGIIRWMDFDGSLIMIVIFPC